ncbi:hypothetical protein [Cryobacterium psychrophilum]|uniref:Uncharacterized protein n=1 Tax=Cryobacterium psychrophilum TaxID=41988 RepID=A0A4Y8KQD0_9MICO|nr:hypothetical protein [Cryobacterium psychrophilum]TDW29295.1 hypothetical protein EDD25_0988 [Cryobacterium psychrophilum]TFD79971.1 hypothetical protein E3T53_06100 [Cryobacterium psychrophilum]
MNVIQQFEPRMHADSVPGFRRLIAQARVSDPILLNPRAMTRMVEQINWMLRRVGADGIRLTKAGHLPPSVVIEATTELDWGWPVTVNRESHISPLREMRLHMRDVGLLRISKGTLLRTAKGRALTDSPRALWWHLARTVHKSRVPEVRDATRLLLLFVATRSLDQSAEYLVAVARGLETIGWAEPGGDGVSTAKVHGLLMEKWRLLNRLGVFEPTEDWYGNSWTPSVGGAAFARAALQTEASAAS